MAIPLLQLDDRQFADIIAELQAMIPSYAPAWTNHNLSDPGITVMELFAWLAEALVYRINRVPETSRRRFFELLGASHQPPTPALLQLRVRAPATAGGRVGGRAGGKLTLPPHTPLFAYPGGGRDAIPFETMEETVFSADLPQRTVVVRQTEQLAEVYAGTVGSARSGSAAEFPVFRLDQPFALPTGDYPRPPYLEIGGVRWQYTRSLASSGPDDAHFTIKRGRVVVFGDGVHGAIPPAEQAIFATWRTARRPGAWQRGQRLGVTSARRDKPRQTFTLPASLPPPLAADLQAASDLEPTVRVVAASVTGSTTHWTYSPSLLEIEGPLREFTIEPWVNGVRFGDGRSRGALPPPAADVYVTYRATLGYFDPLDAATDFAFIGSSELRGLDVMTGFTVLRPGARGTTPADERAAAMAVIKPIWRGVTGSDLSTIILREQPDTFGLQSRAGDSLAAMQTDRQDAGGQDAEAQSYQPGKLGVLATPHPRYALEDKADKVGRPLLLGPDGRSLVTAHPHDSGGETFRLWNLAAQSVTELQTDGEPEPTFSPGGSRLLIHSSKNYTNLIDTATGQPLFAAAPVAAEQAGQGTARDRTGHQTGDEAGDETGDETGDQDEHAAMLRAAISLLSPDGRRWLTVTDDDAARGTLRAGDDGSAIAHLRPGGIVQAAFSPDSRRLGTLHASHLHVLRLHARRPLVPRRHAAHSWRLWLHCADSGAAERAAARVPIGSRRIVFSPDGRLLVTVRDSGRITVHRGADAARPAAFDLPARLMSYPDSLQFSPTGTRLLAICADGSAYLWSLHTYTQVARLAHEQTHAPVTGAVYSRDGLHLATYDAAGGVCTWRAQPGRRERTFDLGAPVEAAAFNAAATRLAAINAAHAIRVWDLQHCEREPFKIDRPDGCGSAALNAAGRWVAWVEDNRVRVWDIDAGRITATLHHSRRHTGDRLALFGPVACPVACPVVGGPLLLTVMDRAQGQGQGQGQGQDRRIQVWNVEQVREAQAILDERRLIASQPVVAGPDYEEIGLEAVLVRTMPPQRSREELQNAVTRAVYAFFDPLTGGPDGTGWTLGRPVHSSEVYQVLERTPGIDHVERLCIFKRGDKIKQGTATGRLEQITIADYCLVNLVIEPQAITVRDPQRMPFVVPV